MTKVQVIIFALALLLVVGGIWCLTLSIQNMKLEKIKERSGK